MNPKYWLFSKMLFWALKYFAKHKKSDITDGVVKFMEVTLDATKPTDFQVIKYIDKKLDKEGE